MKRIILIILGVITIVFGTLTIKYVLLSNTEDLPYHNLTIFSTNDYYIYCDISYNDERNTIVTGNWSFYNLLSIEKSKIFSFHPFYSLWLNNAIKHNLPIKVDEKMYNVLKQDFVDKNLIIKYKNSKILDSTLISSGEMPKNLALADYKAMLYILLKKGINCHKDCETGNIKVEIPPINEVNEQR